jgi:hypothetical protein
LFSDDAQRGFKFMNCERAAQPRIPPIANSASAASVVAFGTASDRPNVVGCNDIGIPHRQITRSMGASARAPMHGRAIRTPCECSKALVAADEL